MNQTTRLEMLINIKNNANSAAQAAAAMIDRAPASTVDWDAVLVELYAAIKYVKRAERLRRKELMMFTATGVINPITLDVEKLVNAYVGGVNLDYENWKKGNPEGDEDYEPFGYETILCGFKKNADGLYEPDPEAEVSFIYNGDRNTIQVVLSKWVIKDASWCSPCYPNQADLDTIGGGITAYTFGPEWFNERYKHVGNIVRLI